MTIPTETQEPAGQAPQSGARGWLVAAMAAGVVLRMVHYFANRSFWLDEALLAQNVAARGFFELTQPLDLNQGAPVGYLWLVKLCTLGLGNNEYAMRLVPFAASVLSLPLIWLVGRRLMGPLTGLLATAILAVSPMMVYYGAEAKQYAVDAAVALLIVHLAARFAESPRPGRGVALLIAGALAVWVSLPAVFVMAAVGVWLLTELPVRSDRRLLGWAVAVAGIWGLSFVVNYTVHLRSLSQNAALTDFWQYAFLRVPPRSAADVRQYVSVVIDLFELTFGTRAPSDATGQRVSMLGLVLWVAGLCAIGRRDVRLLALLLLPYLFVLMCAALEKYPARDRLVLFFVPLAVLSIAAGLAEVLTNSDRSVRRFGVILLCGVLLLPTLYGVNSLMRPPAHEEVRPAILRVASEAEPGDALYVYWESAHVVRYYEKWQPALPPTVQVTLGEPPSETNDFAAQLAPLKGRRLWVLWSHVHGVDELYEGADLLHALADRGEPREVYRLEGASLYLFSPQR